MSERPRAPLFTAEPDDVVGPPQPLFARSSNSATQHVVSDPVNYTGDKT